MYETTIENLKLQIYNMDVKFKTEKNETESK